MISVQPEEQDRDSTSLGDHEMKLFYNKTNTVRKSQTHNHKTTIQKDMKEGTAVTQKD